MITIHNVSKTYIQNNNTFKALDHVSLSWIMELLAVRNLHYLELSYDK
jgi:hypothetical protein